MRQVRTCDFCGDDASGVYEPLPSSIPDAPRMLLCEACRDRLSSVVDPLLARIEGQADTAGGGGPAGDAGDPDATSAYRDLDEGRSGAADGADGADLAGAADVEAREWPADPRERSEEGAVDEAPADEGPAEVGATTGDGETAADEPVGATGGESGPVEETTTTPDAPAPAEDDQPSGTSAAPPPSVDDLTDDGSVEVSESRDASGRTQRERGGAPRGYRKVLRFLENRELPVDRAEAERLAAEAYELDAGEVGAAIDHAVQYGRLREVSGELRR